MPDRPTPNRKMNWSSMSKNLVFWLLIILLPIAFYRMIGSSRQDYREIAYTKFREQLENSNISKVEITSGKFVKGEFKQPVMVERTAVEQFSVVLPIQDSEQLIDRLEELDAEVGLDA